VSGAATGTRPPGATGPSPAPGTAAAGPAGRRWPRLLLAAASGLLSTAAFPPYGLWPLAVPAVAGLVLACRDQPVRRGALLGLVHGLGLFLPLLAWLRVVGADA
jgi:apolipoprotein N-acyltransferase